MCDVCNGEGRVVKEKCNDCHGEGRVKTEAEIKVNIPSGVSEGNYIPLEGQGNAGMRGGPAGDLFIHLEEEAHAIFIREEDDIYFELDLSLIDAAIGADVVVPTLKGKAKLKIDAGLLYNVIDCMATLGGNLYAASSYPGAGGLFHTTNNGISWSNDTAGMGRTNGGIYLSTNHGTSWIKKNTGFGSYTPPIFKLFTANNYIFAGTYSKSVWRRSYADIIGVQNISTEIPSSFMLHQNFPNPFNPQTKIRYEITKSSFVKLFVTDMTGKEVETLVSKNQSGGVYEADFNG
ncbi:unnamed protein product, partial [Rotaria sp. Silwood1]